MLANVETEVQFFISALLWHCDSFAAEECYSDVVQQARAAVEADTVREELMNEITTGGRATTETSCTLTVSD